MVEKLSCFEPLENAKGLFVAQRAGLRCTALKLKDGRVCVYSPVSGLNQLAKESLDEIGNVSYLLAPNHYHNKGLDEYARAYPKVYIVASSDAMPRLKKVTTRRVGKLDSLQPVLPRSLTILYPKGLKTGEVWIRVKTRLATSWLVGDAFCTTKANSKKPITNKPELLGTFPRMGVADATMYRDWVEQQITKDNPSTIVPCHGSIIRSPKLSPKLLKLMVAFS